MAGNNRRTFINLISSMGVLITNILISFFLSPYIVRTIGVEANGFVTLANNFVLYADLIVTALNSMASRYITIAYIQKEYKKANLYYNSVFWGNWIIVVVFLLPAIVLIAGLENFVNVPSDILFDVKILFSFVFFSFFIRTGAPNWTCGTYITNRLDRTYIPNLFSSLFRCVFLFFIFTIFTPHVWYVGLSASILTLFTLAVAGYNTHTLTPELKIDLKNRICSWKVIKELVGSGIWNSISIVGNTLLSGLDLIICNVFIGATEMGIVSLSKILPNLMSQLSDSIRGAFAPELTINYAKGDKKAVLRDIRRAMKLTSVIMTIPTAGIIVMGDAFFALWVPSQDAKLLQILSILAILGYTFTAGTQVLYNVFTTVNKVKYNAVAMLISGVVSTLATLILIMFTDLDIFAVAGVSTIVNIIRNMSFTLTATAKFLGFKWYQFFPEVATSLLSTTLIIIVGSVIRIFMPVGSWGLFIVTATIIAAMGLAVNILIVLNKDERLYLFGLVKRKIKK